MVILDQIHVQMTDKSWVGAWWLGYIILGAWVVITAIPLVWFPKAMDKENDAEDIEQNKQELAYQKGIDPFNSTDYELCLFYMMIHRDEIRRTSSCELCYICIIVIFSETYRI